MGIHQFERRNSRPMTYSEYLQLGDQKCFEQIDGMIYDMSPSPSERHQRVSGNLCALIWNYLMERQSTCAVYHAPLDLLPFADDEMVDGDILEWVHPDIFVMCNAKRKGHAVAGCPDWVIEILSPDSYRRDNVSKLDLYCRTGVPEYWVIDPANRGVLVHFIEERQVVSTKVYAGEDVIAVNKFDGLEIPLSVVFHDIE